MEWSGGWVFEKKKEKPSAWILSVESLSLWETHPSVHLHAAYRERDHGWVSTQAVFHPDEFLRFLSSQLVKLHQNCCQKKKPSFDILNIWMSKIIPGSVSGAASLWIISGSLQQTLCVRSETEVTRASHSGQLLLMTPLILSISAVCHCHSVTIEKCTTAGEGQAEDHMVSQESRIVLLFYFFPGASFSLLPIISNLLCLVKKSLNQIINSMYHQITVNNDW